MDARVLLESVGAVYAALQSLTVDIVSISEQGDADASSRNEHRTKAYYQSPDQVRIEQRGLRGHITVCNGSVIRHYIPMANRYSQTPFRGGHSGPGCFNPDFPLGRDTFRFDRIAETTSPAEMLTSEPGHYRVRASYEPPPELAVRQAHSPITFLIDADSSLVKQMEGTMSHRMPTHDEVRTTRQTLVFSGAILNEPIPPEMFEFSPPPDCIEMPGRGGGFVGGGSGSGRGGGAQGSYETWHSNDWTGDTLIEQFKLRRGELNLIFERRVLFSASELDITERISGAKEPFERRFNVPLNKPTGD
jgi:hypothetical protein